ncbi:hypothetical protein [Burkholderia cenocepacia]|uniref:hypothetical protein n=1 Tax=Burkholderia cenocepacia TaxID=95486 RepID=UPI0007621797|nr:hypothetical protein [Burkholderia cenocepacia]KWU26307.1 hypothetical protein AS149_25280 [Burkholderia cenocepacia]
MSKHYRLIGYKQHTPDFPGFVLPIFERNGHFYMQQSDESRILAFVKTADDEPILGMKSSYGRLSQIGDPTLYGFAWSLTDTWFGERKRARAEFLPRYAMRRKTTGPFFGDVTYLDADVADFAASQRLQGHLGVTGMLDSRLIEDEQSYLEWISGAMPTNLAPGRHRQPTALCIAIGEGGVEILRQITGTSCARESVAHFTAKDAPASDEVKEDAEGADSSKRAKTRSNLPPVQCLTMAALLSDQLFWEGQNAERLSTLIASKLEKGAAVLALFDANDPSKERQLAALMRAVSEVGASWIRAENVIDAYLHPREDAEAYPPFTETPFYRAWETTMTDMAEEAARASRNPRRYFAGPFTPFPEE